MAIYTKTGDRGETGLYDPTRKKNIRISKSSAKINAIGSIDEVNNYLGVCVSLCKDKKTKSFLENIQSNLFLIGSILAGAKNEINILETKILEKEIDKMEGNLPPLGNFILPGGGKFAAHLHFARSLVRKAERDIVFLDSKEKVNFDILSFINRLSDFLFMLAREVNFKEKYREKVWKVIK